MRNDFKSEYRPHFVEEIFGKMDENYDGIVTMFINCSKGARNLVIKGRSSRIFITGLRTT